jgi:hypothetical protein
MTFFIKENKLITTNYLSFIKKGACKWHKLKP